MFVDLCLAGATGNSVLVAQKSIEKTNSALISGDHVSNQKRHVSNRRVGLQCIS